MAMFRNGASVLCLMLCVGCSPKPAEVRPPVQTVTVVKPQLVPLPWGLVRPCAAPSDPAKISTNAQLLDAYLDDRTALIACAARVDAIRAIQPEDEHGNDQIP